jgi:UDP-N-acetylglucosamine--N-acetylmuramyl-(pentapeptide) pyrophosphoryl-undecaprenol N-acetylglucosamine transferase
LSIVHQAGTRQLEETRAAFAASGADSAWWSVEAFLTDMPAQYAAADLVLARSGSTVAELAAAGKPSLLVPFAAAADDHQRKNAEVFAAAGAAVMMLQVDVTPETLLGELTRLLLDRAALAEMGAKARSLAHPGAVEKIAEMVVGLAR